MKKSTLVLALIMCLALTVFAFASCSTKTADATTADPGTASVTTVADGTAAGATTADATTADPGTTPATTVAEPTSAEATTAEPTTAEATEPEPPAHVHTPATEYTVDTPATCTEPGSKSYHCTECNAIITETAVVIPAGHVPGTEYVVDVPATCGTVGSESLHCTVCNQSIAETAREIPATNDHNPGATCTPSDSDPDLHTRVCSTCGAVLTEEHSLLMTVAETVATYTCVDCGYSFETTVNTVSYQETPALDKFSIQNSDTNTTVAKSTYDSDGDDVDDCVRTTMTNSGSKYWMNYNNGNPTYVDGKTNVISFKTDIRIASGATPTDGNDLFWYYYAFSGNASGSNDQGYGFRFRENEGKIKMSAFAKETGSPTFDVTLDYDTWYSIRCDVTVTTEGSTHTLHSIRMYVDDQLVHSVNLTDLNYASYSTNKVRMMIIGYSGAIVTYDIKNVGTFVGSVQ